MGVGCFYRMARVGLWIGLVHHLGTLDVPPIMGLRLIKPMLMNRWYEAVYPDTGSVFVRYVEYAGCLRHGWWIEGLDNVDYKSYERDRSVFVYTDEPVTVKIGPMKLRYHRQDYLFKWKKDALTKYRLRHGLLYKIYKGRVVAQRKMEAKPSGEWHGLLAILRAIERLG